MEKVLSKSDVWHEIFRLNDSIESTILHLEEVKKFFNQAGQESNEHGKRELVVVDAVTAKNAIKQYDTHVVKMFADIIK